MSNSKDVFVIMPFSSTPSCTAERWTEIFEDVFKPAVEDTGFNCQRAVPETGSLIGSIISKLRTARIVLADITDRNPNVFYELGVRHSLSKRTIIVTQKSEDIPSDLRGYWFIKYGISPRELREFKKEIVRLLALIEKDPDKPDNPISDYLERENINISTVINRENVKKLSSLYTEITGNLAVLRQFQETSIPYQLLSTDCIRLLLQTLYLDLGTELLRDFFELNNKLKMVTGLPSRSLVDSTIDDLQRLARSILSVRNQLAEDRYKEPENISLMAWKPAESDIYPPGCVPADYQPTFSRCIVCGGSGTSANGNVCVVCGRAS